MIKPKICMINIDDDIVNSIKKDNFYITKANLGTRIKTPTSYDETYRCKLDHNIPRNLHEYDIIVIDLLTKENEIEYIKEDQLIEGINDTVSYFVSQYPQQIFEPKNLVLQSLNNVIKKMQNKQIILIIFAHTDLYINYHEHTISTQGGSSNNNFTFGTFDFMEPYNRFNNNICGEVFKLSSSGNCIAEKLYKYVEDTSYYTSFKHPKVWDGKNYVDSKIFLPLLENELGEIVSYIEAIDKSLILMLPQFKDKTSVLSELLMDVMPSIVPSLFPELTTFNWKTQKEYWLPGHSNLLDEKEKMNVEYQKKLNYIDNEIELNNKKYNFLIESITETGDTLVKAIKAYLEWLGFENIKLMDEEEGRIKEEDIQIEIPEGLLIIEIKGIGGTSKDSECSQISKIRNRRQKERQKFDVYALYIVNHQRYLPPINRQNPPFLQEQISDAEEDERGLLTTWELFKTFNYINNGLLTKQNVKKSLLKYGLIEPIRDNLRHIGKAAEIYKDGKVVIINLNNIKFSIGDTLIINKDNQYFKVKIVNIQLNDTNVKEADNGEVGLELNKKISRNSGLYIYN